LAGICIALPMGIWGLVAAVTPPPPLELRLLVENVWAREELVVWIGANAKGSVSVDLSYPEAPARNRSNHRALTSPEVAELRQLAEKAALFSGQAWGKAPGAFDLPLMTLRVNDGERIAILVGTDNVSFASGPRKELLDYLSLLSRGLAGP
jgi:hypothetical protein